MKGGEEEKRVGLIVSPPREREKECTRNKKEKKWLFEWIRKHRTRMKRMALKRNKNL